jgi:hydroxymethylbilane synthase
MYRDTRLAKLDAPSSPFSCILLASAGLLRLGLDHRITQRLEPTIFPYAVGQGALGIEVSTNTDRQDILQLIQHVDHKPSRWRGMAERAMLRSLQGGCSSSIGVSSSFEPLEKGDSADTQQQGSESGTLRLQATVIHIEGLSEISAEDVGTVQCDEEAEKLGVSVANMLLEKGVRDLLPQQL